MSFIRLILTLLAPWPLWGARKKLSVQWLSMTDVQKDWLKWAYEQGKPVGLGETLRAICWQESSAGAALKNKKDGSWGMFGVKALSAATRHFDTWPDRPTKEQIDGIAESLLKDPWFSAKMCIAEIAYWQTKRRGFNQWTMVWASYNAGWDWWYGEDYAADIMAKIKFLRAVIN